MKPSIFIASSSESLGVACELQALLVKHADVTIWDQDYFETSGYTLLTIVDKLALFDYGIFLFSPDDIVNSRGEQHFAPRDNVVLELGIFIGRLGKDSCFIVFPEKKNLKFPSDLNGITGISYVADRRDGNINAALGPVATTIKKLISNVDAVSRNRIIALETYLADKHNKHYLCDDFIKDVICKNQGALAQFNFIAGQRHKELKDLISNKLPKASVIKKIKEKLENLDVYLNCELLNVWRFNAKLIIDSYFKRRYGKNKPRVCLKMNTDCNTIRSLFRDRIGPSNSMCYLIDTNTGFEEVFRSGLYYLCNNIPLAVSSGKYVNPRLDLDKTKKYVFSEQNELSLRGKDRGDKDWQECWKPVLTSEKKVLSKPEECYKSTLIVPLTLFNNELAPEFMQHFNLDISDEPGRAIYGYLCFDSQFTDFFIEDMDINIGYTFADLLSLYLITYLNYTEFSTTYQKAIGSVSKRIKRGKYENRKY